MFERAHSRRRIGGHTPGGAAARGVCGGQGMLKVAQIAITVSLLMIAGVNTWAFAERGAWIYMVIGGLFPPLYGLALWWSFRRKGGEVQKAADAMVLAVSPDRPYVARR